MTHCFGQLHHPTMSPNKKKCANQSLSQKLSRKRLRELDIQEENSTNKRASVKSEPNSEKKIPIVLLSRITQGQTERETSSNEDTDYNQEHTGLSAYELKRLKNIKENAKFLSCLNLLETASGLRNKNLSQTRGIKREKPQNNVEESMRRRSMRLQRVDPSGAPLPKLEVSEPVVEENPLKPPGPLKMIPSNQEDTGAVEIFLKTWKMISQENMRNSEKPPSGNLKRYKAGLEGMTLVEEAVAKVVKNRIFSVAIHPSQSRSLVAAGDKWGQVGLWDLDLKSPDDGVFMFWPHSRPVCCMQFSPSNSAQLFSLSYDGTVRCGDVSCSVFDEVYRDEESSFSSFDFLSASVLLVSDWDAHISLVDQRTPGTSYELQASLGMRSCRTVHLHPLHKDLFVAAGASDVRVYDIRQLSQKRTQHVLSLPGHTKSVASAYFSPISGNRILTTCADDRIRVYDSSNMSVAAPLLTTIRHNNHTGRWLTRFRAVWDPKEDSCFVVGSMARPRQIEVYHESGDLLHTFYDSEYLGSVCSINAMHPTRNLLVGGNSSGRLHVFRD
ncbi:WD repeat-containing protein 76 [Discoglossus pictus]